MLRELARNPRDIGAVCSSSPALANEMARAIHPSLLKSGCLIELGAGTGPVTEALLRRGISRDKLIIVEKSEALAQCLKERFNGATVLCCGAEEISSKIKLSSPVAAIVSSLPFRSLPADVSAAIMSEVGRILAPGGLFVQFTYALLGEMPFITADFRKLRSRFILRNVPPAKVEVFRRRKTSVGV
ncbi:methyltransferase [Synergistales bacterium]|nr:methyltransferase [Synergistales bacterium]